jgi:hypothetical protein
MSFILYLYMRLIYNIGHSSLKDISKEELLEPQFSFNLIELFRLADFFRVMELMQIFCHNFFSPSVMFSPTCRDLLQQECTMASIIMCFSHTESPKLLYTLVKTYNKGTGGL